MKAPTPSVTGPALKTAVIASVITLVSSLGWSTPYATSLTNDAGVISFRLNESADNVRIISSGGATTNELGALPKGLTVTNLGIAGVFQVEVTKSSGPGYTQGVVNQISVDTNTFVQFVNQRGVAVNQNPASPYFGRVYVSVATGGTAGTRGAITEGVFLLNADQTDAVGQGNTGLTGGIDVSTGGAESLYRLTVGEDDNLYIADWSDAIGTLYVADPNISPGSGTNVLVNPGGPFPVTSARNHGSVFASYVEGSLGAGTLVVYTGDEDYQTDPDSTSAIELNSVWRYDIGSGPLPFSGVPVKMFTAGINFVAQVADMTRGPDGKFYYTQRRADVATTTGLFVFSDDGTTQLYSSLQASRDLTGNPSEPDILSESGAVAVSPDGAWVAVIKRNTNSISFLPLDNGIPNMTNRVVLAVTPTTGFGRDIGFDIVGNIYSVSSGQGLLRIYSPGGFTVATTGSDGTFDLFTPQTDVTAVATDDFASESGDTAAIEISRTGDTSGPLTVFYTLSGTASNGVDYTLLPGSVTILAGQSSTNITVTPIDDAVAEFTETVILTIAGGTNYTIGTAAVATVAIADNETPEISITALQGTMYERIVNDYVTMQATRKGDTNTTIFPAISYTGAAANGVDFSGPSSIGFNPGDVTSTFQINPIDNGTVDGNRMFNATIASGAGYSIGTPNSASATIIDDDLGPETELYSDDFETDTSANWTVLSGSGDGVEDFIATFSYDYGVEGIPPAPGSSTTLGLKLSANKNDGTASAAGVNAYPNSQNFSGDFALRFHMYSTVNTGAGTTEHSIFGINHSGTKTNWVNSSAAGTPLDIDGLWYAIVLDTFGSGHVHYTGNGPSNPALLVTNRLASTLVDVFKAPPFFTPGAGASGSPSNPEFSGTPTWVDVEVRKVGNLITCTINGTVILQTVNTTSFTSGNIMVGHNDQFNSIGLNSSTIIDNLRVVDLTVPTITITSIAIVGSNVQIDFTGSTSDTPGSFSLRKSSTVGSGYAVDGAASIIQLSPGNFRATTAVSGPQQYFRISKP